MKKYIAVTIIILINFACSSVPGDRMPSRDISAPAKIKSYSGTNKSKTISNNTNIHYNTNYCTECHTNYPKNPEIAKRNLKFNGDYKLLCKCHYEGAGKDPHPVDIIPSQEIKTRIPSGFPLSNGKITCDTCHDISIQCKDIREVYYRQEKFLRGGLYSNILDECFLCHDSNKFKKYNPHKQLDKNDDIIKETCLYCHSEVPDIKLRDNKAESKLITSPTALCRGCHMNTSGTSLHDKHISRIPTADVLDRIRATEKKFNIKLPLTADGKVTCITCHNPHEKNLIPDYRSGAIEAEKYDTSSGFSGAVCTKCHEMK